MWSTSITKTTEIRTVPVKKIDEIVSGEVEFFHLEYMSDKYVWIGLNLKDGRMIHIDLTSKSKIVTRTRDD